MDFLQRSISFPLNVGVINERKKLIASKILLEKFPVQAPSDPFSLVMTNNSTSESILITQDRIVYINNHAKENIKTEKIIDSIKSLCNSLLLDEPINAIIDTTKLIDTTNSHDESLTLYKIDMHDTNIFGIGYRFFFNENDIKGEFKYEPYIQDKSKYYLQFIINYEAKKYTLKELIDNFIMISGNEFMNKYINLVKNK